MQSNPHVGLPDARIGRHLRSGARQCNLSGFQNERMLCQVEGGQYILLHQQDREPGAVDRQQRGAKPSDSSSIISSCGRGMMPQPIAHICCSSF
jgi:hypothetical protein